MVTFLGMKPVKIVKISKICQYATVPIYYSTEKGTQGVFIQKSEKKKTHQ